MTEHLQQDHHRPTGLGMPVSRKSFLRASMTAGLAVAGAGAMTALGPATPASAAPSVQKIKVIAGTGTAPVYGVGATDLGIPARCPDGRNLYIFGDTFADRFGGANWRSPVGLYSPSSSGNPIFFNGAVGGPTAKQLWDYPHDSYFATVIPSDIITIGSTMYLQAIVNGPTFGQVRWTEIWKSTDSGGNWTHTGVKFDGTQDGGRFQLITWALGPDDFVYLYGTGFQRDKGLILYRVQKDSLENKAAYQPWGYQGGWGWGKPATEVLGGKFGEMCLRRYGSKYVLTWFNAGAYRMDAMVLNSPIDNLVTTTKTTLIQGGSWGAEDNTHVAQLYGGYQVPGGSISNFDLIVSQWNTTAGANNTPYQAMQFRVSGLA